MNTPFGWIPLPGFDPIISQTTNYKWLRNGNGTLVLSIDADSLGTTGTYSSYLKVFVSLGLNDEPPAQSITTFPNPASNVLSINVPISFGQNATIEVYTATGKLMVSTVINQTNIFSLSITEFSNGVYFYKVKNSSGKMETGKFLVAH